MHAPSWRQYCCLVFFGFAMPFRGHFPKLSRKSKFIFCLLDIPAGFFGNASHLTEMILSRRKENDSRQKSLTENQPQMLSWVPKMVSLLIPKFYQSEARPKASHGQVAIQVARFRILFPKKDGFKPLNATKYLTRCS